VDDLSQLPEANKREVEKRLLEYEKKSPEEKEELSK
jgi:hypothetical protein